MDETKRAEGNWQASEAIDWCMRQLLWGGSGCLRCGEVVDVVFVVCGGMASLLSYNSHIAIKLPSCLIVTSR